MNKDNFTEWNNAQELADAAARRLRVATAIFTFRANAPLVTPQDAYDFQSSKIESDRAQTEFLTLNKKAIDLWIKLGINV